MTGRRQTVVLIGAGSVVFTQVLVADFARTCPPEGLRLALVDTNPDALDVIARLVRRMVELLRADIEVAATTERRDAPKSLCPAVPEWAPQDGPRRAARRTSDAFNVSVLVRFAPAGASRGIAGSLGAAERQGRGGPRRTIASRSGGGPTAGAMPSTHQVSPAAA